RMIGESVLSVVYGYDLGDLVLILLVCFFFQAEDGIRDRNVTGVQTCALPICGFRHQEPEPQLQNLRRTGQRRSLHGPVSGTPSEIGRASCREREEIWAGDIAVNEGKRKVTSQADQHEDWRSMTSRGKEIADGK